MNFKEYVIDKIIEVTGLEREVIEKSVETPPDEKMGDLAFPCFPLARVMRKAPPVIATELAEKFSEDDNFEKVEAVGGYLNFFFARAAFEKSVLDAVKAAGDKWGSSDMGNGKTVLVEYSSPNSVETDVNLLPCAIAAFCAFSTYPATLPNSFSSH